MKKGSKSRKLREMQKNGGNAGNRKRGEPFGLAENSPFAIRNCVFRRRNTGRREQKAFFLFGRLLLVNILEDCKILPMRRVSGLLPFVENGNAHVERDGGWNVGARAAERYNLRKFRGISAVRGSWEEVRRLRGSISTLFAGKQSIDGLLGEVFQFVFALAVGKVGKEFVRGQNVSFQRRKNVEMKTDFDRKAERKAV